MSRSGYNDDGDGDRWALIRWRGAVRSSIKGARGQAFLRELAAAMDAMPDKRLIANAAVKDGCLCTLGVVAAARGMDLEQLDIDMDGWEWDRIARGLGISEALAREIMYFNDESVGGYEWREIVGPPTETDIYYQRHPRVWAPMRGAEQRRWIYMRNWVRENIKEIRHA